jgi:transposase
MANTKGLPTFRQRHQVPRLVCGSQSKTFERGSPMSKITRVGVDLAKSVIQVHAVDAGGKLVTNRQLDAETNFCLVRPASRQAAWWRWRPAVRLPPLGPQAHWPRPERKNHRGSPGCTLSAAGQEVARMTPTTPQPFAKRRPDQTCDLSPVKTTVTAGHIQCVHSLREGLKEERTAEHQSHTGHAD